MAKADWVKLSQSSGSGNANVQVSSRTEHTGRSPRNTVLSFKGANVETVTRNVYQAGKPEYVDIEDSKAVEKEGKTITITGVSNSSKLTFSLGTGNLEVTIPSSYIANSLSTNNGTAIQGDPGAVSVFNFSIPIVVPKNETVEVKTRQIIVTDNAGNTDVCELMLAGGDAYLRVTDGDIQIDYKGTPVTISVESNISWAIE